MYSLFLLYNFQLYTQMIKDKWSKKKVKSFEINKFFNAIYV